MNNCEIIISIFKERKKKTITRSHCQTANVYAFTTKLKKQKKTLENIKD